MHVTPSRHRRASNLRFVWSAIRSIGARLVFSLLAGMILWSVVPAAFGYRPNLVTSDSMQPSVAEGDIVLTRPIAPSLLRPGMVVLVDDPSRDGPFIHRLRSVDNGIVLTQGDSNLTPDFPAVDPAQIRGEGRILVPAVGFPVVWVSRRPELLLVVAGVVLCGIGLRVTRRRVPRRRPALPPHAAGLAHAR